MLNNIRTVLTAVLGVLGMKAPRDAPKFIGYMKQMNLNFSSKLEAKGLQGTKYHLDMNSSVHSQN